MNPIKILVVEDDAFIAQEITDYLYELGYQVMGLCRSYAQAIKVLERENPDLALLDIELAGKETGIDIAAFIRSQQLPIPIIFLSSKTDPRIIESVKQTQPDAFIVKPFDERDLATNIEIALFRYSQQSTGIESQTEVGVVLNDYYFVRSKNQLLKIKPEEIIWAEADDNYTHLHLAEERHLLSSTLKQVEEKLPAAYFIRIHRSYLVNLKYLDKVEDQYVHLGKKALPIGKSYKSELMQRISLL